jgi:hypothetical protein
MSVYMGRQVFPPGGFIYAKCTPLRLNLPLRLYIFLIAVVSAAAPCTGLMS